MKTLLLLTCLTFFKAMANCQSYYMIGIEKTIGTHYRLPATSLGYGFKKELFTIEAGLKTNYNEYYTLIYSSIGVETKGRLLVGANFGIGTTFNLPRNDRVYRNGQYEYISKGFDKNSITAIYTNAKIGYRVFDGVFVYGSYAYCYKFQWLGIGLKLTSIQ